MKILIDATGIVNETTGAGQYSLQLLKALSEIDNENEYFVVLQKSLSEKHPIFTLATKSNFSLIRANIPAVGPKKQISFLSFLWSTRIQCDLLHGLNSELPLFCNINSIVTIHDLVYLKYPEFLKGLAKLKSKYLECIIKKGAKKANKIIAVSESTKSDIINLLGIKANKIKVIYEASNFNLYAQKNGSNSKIIKKYSIKKPYILFVGEKRPHKNLEGLIKAFAIFKQKYDKWNTNLVITGKQYSNYKSYLMEIKELNVFNSVIFTGFISDEDLKTIYSEAEIFLLVSFYEGFGIPILEAMECGTPVITSDVSSMPEVAGGAALLVNPHNPEEIAEKINSIMNSKGLKKQLIEKGYRRVKEFSWEKTAEQTLKIYKEVYNQ